MCVPTVDTASVSCSPLSKAQCLSLLPIIRPSAARTISTGIFSPAIVYQLHWQSIIDIAPLASIRITLCAAPVQASRPVLFKSTSSPIIAAQNVKLHVPFATNETFNNLGTNVELVINGTLQLQDISYSLAHSVKTGPRQACVY